MFYEFIPLKSDQQRLLIDAAHQYDQWLSAKRTNLAVDGWMSWREKNGTEYLTSGKGNGQGQRSHGARSPETEAQYNTFITEKAKAKESLAAIQSRLAERAPILKAVRLGRVLAPLAQVIREFDVQGMLEGYLWVTGTHAIAAYEAMAGQLFDSTLTATEDLDFLWRAGNNVEVLVKQKAPALLKHLKTVDSSYTVNTERTFQARNSKGLVIDFISDEKGATGAPKEYLKPISIEGQQWILSHPHVEAIAIDTTGLPVRLVVPDPRIFALHKAWVSERKDRNPLKKEKDRKQAVAVSHLIQVHLPQYAFGELFLKSLPEELRQAFSQVIEPALQSVASPSNPVM